MTGYSQKQLLLSIALFALVLAAGYLGVAEKEVVTSRAYKGHGIDRDMQNFVNVHPDTVGTRLDDCQLCHRGGVVKHNSRERHKNTCDYCHFIPFPDESLQGTPETYEDTLNKFGLDYKRHGRDREAVRKIARLDSDGDGYKNNEEIAKLKHPGSAENHPGVVTAPTCVLEEKQMKSLPSHKQFMLVNRTQHDPDFYATYQGVKVVDLLKWLEVDLEKVEGITVIAPDGYRKDFSREQVLKPFPDAVFHGNLGEESMGDKRVVEYPEKMPFDLENGESITGEQWLMVGYQRDGEPLETACLDARTGRIVGAGPYRIIVPQSKPQLAPDRGSAHADQPVGDGYDYDENKDHNAGAMVRGMVAIRINPLPEGYEDFDYTGGGWAFVEKKQLVVYGQGIESEKTKE